MTMIGFATYGDHAEFITDTASYTRRVGRLGRTTKHLTIAHLDAAVLTQGDSDFGVLAKLNTLDRAALVTTFDELVEHMPELMAELWQYRLARADGGEDSTVESVVFLLGWSDYAQEFVAHAFDSAQGFRQTQIKGAWLSPMPWTNHPSGIELRRLKRDMAHHSQLTLVADKWRTKPPLTKPSSVDEWVALAKHVREQRAMEKFFQVIVAGDVFHTRLGRGEVTTRRVHRFNDAGDELLWMLRGTDHPLAVQSPCYCESGVPLRDCCESGAG